MQFYKGTHIMNKEQEEYLDEIGRMYKGIFKKAYTSKSKAAAIHAHCLNCSCLSRTEVELCTVKTCPLWNHRPYQIKRKDKIKKKKE
jgi:hypothetical protein